MTAADTLPAAVAAEPAARLYDDWDWSEACKEDVEREMVYLCGDGTAERPGYIATLRLRIAIYLAQAHYTEADHVGHAFDSLELAKATGELAALSPRATHFRIPLPKEA